MNTNTMKAYNSAVESLDKRVREHYDRCSHFELLGVSTGVFGANDPDVMALRDALREQFQAMVSKLQRSESIDTSPRV